MAHRLALALQHEAVQRHQSVAELVIDLDGKMPPRGLLALHLFVAVQTRVLNVRSLERSGRFAVKARLTGLKGIAT